MRRIFKRMGLSLAAVVLAFGFPLQAYAQDIAYGADVGWLSQLEASGYTWQDVDGSTGDVLEILKEHGVDSIRLRVFVRPPSTSSGRKMMVRNAYWDIAIPPDCFIWHSVQRMRDSVLWWIFITVIILPIRNIRICHRSGNLPYTMIC